jgi:membrane-anchored glycerophosphoryl diester phosphodiesterase (GDPDase)
VIAAFVVILLIVILVSIFLGTIGRIGLIKGTSRAEQGAERLIFGELFSESMPYFWRVFGLSLLIGLLFLVIFLPLIFFGVITAGIGFICILPLLCLLIPISWAAMVVIEQANAAIVLDDLGIGDGLRKGWEVVRSNIGTMIVMALILFIGSAVVGVVLAIPLIVAVFPLAIGAAAGLERSPLMIIAACCAVYLPILLLLNGILTAFIQSAWTLTYLRLTKPRDQAPIVLEANA